MNPQNQKLYVGNLNYDATEDQVRDLFSAYGTVVEVKVIRDRETKTSRGFAFVTMGSAQEADEAKQALNGQPFQGKALLTDWARMERDRSAGGDRRERSEFRGSRRDWNHSGRERREVQGNDRYYR